MTDRSCHPNMRHFLWYLTEFGLHRYMQISTMSTPWWCIYISVSGICGLHFPRSFRSTQIHNKNRPSCKLQYDFMMSVQQIKIDLNVSMITLSFNRKSMIYKLLLTQVTNHKKFMKLKSWKKMFNLWNEHQNRISMFDSYSNNK